MGKKNKFYTTGRVHNKLKTAPVTRCRWCHRDFKHIRIHYNQTTGSNCQLMESEHQKKIAEKRLPFNELQVVASLNELPKYNTLDEYVKANDEMTRNLFNPRKSSSGVLLRTSARNTNALENDMKQPEIKFYDPEYHFNYQEPLQDDNSEDDNNMSISFTDSNEMDLNLETIPVFRNILTATVTDNNQISDLVNNDAAHFDYNDNTTVVMIPDDRNHQPTLDSSEDTLHMNAKERHKYICTMALIAQLPKDKDNVLKIPITDNAFNMNVVSEYKSICRIYEVLNQAHVPLYMYDKIIGVIMEEVNHNNLNPGSQFISRRKLLNWMEKTFTSVPKPNKTILQLELPRLKPPYQVNHVMLNHRTKTEVITFDFEKQLIDLLLDYELFSNMDNLVVNKSEKNPEVKWLPYDGRPDGRIFEVLDGDWYQNYAKKQLIDPTKQFCVPIGLYIDASETVVYQRYSFEPLIMFPLILNAKARNNPRSSRVIALIPNLNAKSSAVKKKNRMGDKYNRSLSIRNYHLCLSVALESLKRVQKNGGMNTYLRLGDDVKQRMITVPVAFILGDAKSQDTLTCRYGPHNTDRMCRACHVSFQESSSLTHNCKWVVHNQFEKALDKLIDNEEIYDAGIITDTVEINKIKKRKEKYYQFLKMHSQHVCRNAFQDIDFANFPRGIFGCTPHDMMHCFLEGVLKYTTRIFIHTFTDNEKAGIDDLVDVIFHKFCSSENKNMLRKNFNKGMTNMTMITADEEIGMALVLLIVGQMDKGYEILKNRKKFDDYSNAQDIDDDFIQECVVIRDVIEMPPDEDSVDDNVVIHDEVHINEVIDEVEDENESDEEEDDNSQSTVELLFNKKTKKDIKIEEEKEKEKTDAKKLEESTEGKCNFKNFVHLIEMLLCFHGWYKSNMAFKWDIDKETAMLTSIRIMLHHLKLTFPRNEGNGWKLQKFHEIMHLPIDVTNFGSPKNFDTGIMENRLIHVGKRNEKLTQRRGPKIFTEQLGNRIYEQSLMDTAFRQLKISKSTFSSRNENEYDIIHAEEVEDDDDDTDEDEDDDEFEICEDDQNANESNYIAEASIYKDECLYLSNVKMGQWIFHKDRPDYIVTIPTHGDGTKWYLNSKIKSLSENNIPDIVVSAITKFLFENELESVECFTTLSFIPKNKMLPKKTFRAHPNYHNKSWYDWAIVKFEPSESDKEREKLDKDNKIIPPYPYGAYPSKVLTFFRVDEQKYAVIHATDYKVSSEKDSVISEKWNLEYGERSEALSEAIIRIVRVETIIDSAFVMQETPGLLPIIKTLPIFNIGKKDNGKNKSRNKNKKGKENENEKEKEKETEKEIKKHEDTILVILIHPKGR